MKKKAVWIALCLAAALFLLTACSDSGSGTEEKSRDTLSSSVKMAVYEGTAGSVTKNLGSDYKITRYNELLKLEKAVRRGDYDVAVLPTTDADWLYGKTGKDLVMLSPTSSGGIYLLSNSYQTASTKMTAFAGKTIYVTGERSTGAVVFRFLMQQAGIGTSSYTIKVLDSYEEIEKAINDYGNFAIVEQPYASRYMKKNSSVVKLRSLGDLFEEETDLKVPTDCMICSRDFYRDRYDDLPLVMADYQKATEKAKDRNARAVFYGSSSRGVSLLRRFNKALAGSVTDLYGGAGDTGRLYFTEK